MFIEKDFLITITDVNEKPTDILINQIQDLSEKTTGLKIADIKTVDSDINDVHTYTIDDERFEIVENSLKLKENKQIDYKYEKTITLNITSTDKGGLSVNKTVTFNVNNIKEAPTDIQLDNQSIYENITGGVIGKVSANNPDGEKVTYKINDNDYLMVDKNTGVLSLKPNSYFDYEKIQNLLIKITAYNQSLFSEKEFTISVIDVNEKPEDIILDNDTLLENQQGAIIGKITTIDKDSKETHQYQINDERFEIINNQLKLKDNQKIDFADEPKINLTITATDKGGLSLQKQFTLNVEDDPSYPNNPPSDIILTTNIVSENKKGAIIGELSAIDMDKNNTHTFDIDDNRFEIVNNQLKIKDDIFLDYEKNKSLNINITATDNGGLSIKKTFTIQVKDEIDITQYNSTTTKISNIAVTADSIKETEQGYKIYHSNTYGDYVDIKDFGADVTGKTDSINAINQALSFAHRHKVALYLNGNIYISSPITINENNKNVTGIFGDGQGKTTIYFDKQQKGRHNANSNDTISKEDTGILIDGQHGKFISNLSIQYHHKKETDFYRHDDTYFGKVNGILALDVNHTTIDNVEVSGANRAGIHFGSAKVFQVNPNTGKIYKHDYMKGVIKENDPDFIIGHNNKVINSYLHDNRVAGVLFSYQKNFKLDNNILAKNGHQDDGGTGYGAASMAGSYNLGVTYINNTTEGNFRKGLDVHDGNNVLIQNNTSDGDRLYGIAVYNRQFTMNHVKIKNNIINQNPDFRLPVDDTFNVDGQTYYGYSGIHLQTNTQANYKHFKSADTGIFEISGNKISGIDVYKNEHHTYGIEFRNHEPDMLYDLIIRNNEISGKETKYIIGIINNGVDYFNLDKDNNPTSGKGMGNITIANNTANFDIIRSRDGSETPVNIQEDQIVNNLRGFVNIHHNNFNINKISNSGTEMFQVIGNAKNINISDNKLNIAGIMDKSIANIINYSNTETNNVIINNNKLSVNESQTHYQRFIGNIGRISLDGGNNTINNQLFATQTIRHDIENNQYLSVTKDNDFVYLTGHIKGKVFTGSGHDDVIINGKFSGQLDLANSYHFTKKQMGDFLPSMIQDIGEKDSRQIKNTATIKGEVLGDKNDYAKIIGGDGRDILIFENKTTYLDVDTKNNQDVIAFQNDVSNSTIHLGNGGDTLFLSGLLNNSTIDFGEGIDVAVIQGKKGEDVSIINPSTNQSQILNTYLDTVLDFGQFKNVEHVRLEGMPFQKYDASNKSLYTVTPNNTLNITMSDLFNNNVQKVFISGDNGDIVDLGANGKKDLGGFHLNKNIQHDNYHVYSYDDNTNYLLYIEKDITVI